MRRSPKRCQDLIELEINLPNRHLFWGLHGLHGLVILRCIVKLALFILMFILDAGNQPSSAGVDLKLQTKSSSSEP